MSDLLVGTSSWTKPEWAARFYPRGTAREPLPYYATQFRTVEADSTHRGCPPPQWVESWREKAPEGFTFAAKVPKSITGDRKLVDCEAELHAFLTVMRGLETRLGPILFQLPRFGRKELPNLDAFLARLEPVLALLPADLRFAVEVRNPEWLEPPLFDLLRAHRVALAWCDSPKMPGPKEWLALPGALTTDFLYVRLLGDLSQYGKTIPDTLEERRGEVQDWVQLLEAVSSQVDRTYLYASYYFAGYAPATAQLVQQLWDQRHGAGTGEGRCAGQHESTK